MALQHWNFTVFGNFQGVFHRISTQEKADALGLNGFVKNVADGSVYLEVEEDPSSIQVFFAWCKKGPILAKADTVKSKQDPLLQHFDRFENDY